MDPWCPMLVSPCQANVPGHVHGICVPGLPGTRMSRLAMEGSPIESTGHIPLHGHDHACGLQFAASGTDRGEYEGLKWLDRSRRSPSAALKKQHYSVSQFLAVEAQVARYDPTSGGLCQCPCLDIDGAAGACFGRASYDDHGRFGLPCRPGRLGVQFSATELSTVEPPGIA